MIEKFNAGAAGANETAVVFVHGFTGDLKGTWGRIPEFLAQQKPLAGWDLFGFGYQSNRRFDILKLWSADADLEQISTELYTSPELKKYKRLAFVAHSMGGLVVQRALVKYNDLRARASHVFLFGTPSAGLEKANLASFLKQQVRNMSTSGEFIRQLREGWTKLNLNLEAGVPIRFLAVAGELDQFVPPESSLGPFPQAVCRVIPGNHISMLKCDDASAPTVQVLTKGIGAGAAGAGPRNSARVAVEAGEFQRVINDLWPNRSTLDDEGAVLLALALEGQGRAEEAIEFLQQHQPQGTDVLGVLAGRLKRRWQVQHRRADVEKARELYQRGYDRAIAKSPPDHPQAYYHGINLAYLELAYGGDYRAAQAMAAEVLKHCEAITIPKDKFWRLATEGDALILLGRTEEGVAKHATAAAEEMNPWQALSIQEQSIRVADLCGLTKAETEKIAGLYEGGNA